MSPCWCCGPTTCSSAEVPRAQQLIAAFEKTGCPVLALMPMDRAESQRYGVPDVQEDLGDGLLRITGLVEKPEPQAAPSEFAAIGGYVVTPGSSRNCRRSPTPGTSTRPARST